MKSENSILLSVVTTLYNSENYIDEFCDRIITVVEKITPYYEMIFVIDGSPDHSLEKAKQLQKKYNNIKIIELSRNFGHHRAMMSGLSQAAGQRIFLIDCDLEEEPELLQLFWLELQKNQDVDLIYGVQKKRKGGLFERWSGSLFYKLINLISGIPVPKNVAIARLMTRRYVDSLLLHTEKELVLIGISALTGYIQKPIYIDKKSKGTTVYSLGRKIDLAINFITSISSKPLLYIFYIGSCITTFSLGYFIYITFNALFFNTPVTGWTSIMASIWLFGGLVICFMGIMGIYISKIFIEVKNRPLVIIKEIHDQRNS